MTLKDIAKIVNLSESTVSRALNDNPRIAKKTRDLVMKVAKENNFVINSNARSLATKKSHRIGIIFPNDFYVFNKRDFFSQLEKNFLIHSEKFNYEILIIRSNSLEKVIKGGNVDGLVIANRNILKEDIEVMEKYGIPHVFVAYKPEFLRDEEIVVFKSDNIGCGYEVAKYLHQKGCKKLLTVTSQDKKLTDYVDRTVGFINYLKEFDLFTGNNTHECNMTFEDGRDLLIEKEEFLKSFDGIYFQQDKVAIGILSLADKYKIEIPKDLKIIGHDDLELAAYFYPKLTTVQQDYEGITLKALTYLIDSINNGKDRDKESPCRLKSFIIERETV